MRADVAPLRRPAAGLLRRSREARRRASRSWRTSPAAAASRASASRRSASTTSPSAAARPINDQNRALLDALPRGPRRRRPRPAGLLGQPQLGPLPHRHAASRCATDGVTPGRLLRDQRLLVATPAAGSTARTSPRPPRRCPGAPRLDKLRHYFNHPGFVEPIVDATLAALADLPDDVRERRPPGVRHPLDPRRDERAPAVRGGGAYVGQHRSAASRRSPSGSGRRPARKHPSRARLLLAVRRARTSRGWSPTSTTTSRSSPRTAPARPS